VGGEDSSSRRQYIMGVEIDAVDRRVGTTIDRLVGGGGDRQVGMEVVYW
jgi:hypothetical protein